MGAVCALNPFLLLFAANIKRAARSCSLFLRLHPPPLLMPTFADAAAYLNQRAPLSLQGDWDNSRLQVGNPETEITGIITSLDLTAEVIEEALQQKANFIVAHHPLLFKGLKSLTGANDQALAAAGRNIGNYSHCSFQATGTGTFKPLDGAQPFIGQQGELERVEELRLEMVPTAQQESKIIKALHEVHPYEIHEPISYKKR